jgi:hypothetical protein
MLPHEDGTGVTEAGLFAIALRRCSIPSQRAKRYGRDSLSERQDDIACVHDVARPHRNSRTARRSTGSRVRGM